MKILNLGCGTSASSHPDVVNIDWSLYLRLRRNPLLRTLAPLFLRGERLEKFKALPANILVHNLAKGIPFADASVEAVYHSHVLEHLDRPVAAAFLRDVYRVLKPGGVHRMAVPDFEKRCRDYLNHLDACSDPGEAVRHDEFIAGVLEQSVRKAAFGSAQQSAFRRRLENRILGDARRRGETHQWMYDRVNLLVLLEQAGFREIRVCEFNRSRIPGWGQYRLDLAEHRNESLYVEAVR
jgi:ubiquinone/menaquinone biosynthesis C-methylase UbiE